MIVVVRGRCGLNTPTSSTGAFLVVIECLLLASFLLHADLTATATVDEPDVPAPLVATAGVQTEIDAFMEKVLARRETNWIELQDYVLDEKESLDVRGPGGVVLDGFHREFTWYVRDHVLVRSPVRYDGVTIGENGACRVRTDVVAPGTAARGKATGRGSGDDHSNRALHETHGRSDARASCVSSSILVTTTLPGVKRSRTGRLCVSSTTRPACLTLSFAATTKSTKRSTRPRWRRCGSIQRSTRS